MENAENVAVNAMYQAKVDALEDHADSVDNQFGTIENVFDAHDGRISSLETELDDIDIDTVNCEIEFL